MPKVGVWIDHKKAIVVRITDNGEEIRTLMSKVEKQLRRTGDSPMKGTYEPQMVLEDDNQQRAHTDHLNVYYDAVIAAFLRDAESILLLGPGEAKGELKKRLEKNKHNKCTITVETVDKMTDRQIAAKVRQQ